MKVILDENAIMPTRAHAKDAGLDLYAPESQIVPAKDSAIFDIGIHIQLPADTVGMIKSRSGLNINNGLTCTGVIDEGYTGSIKVRLDNSSGYDYRVKRGDKIAQLVILPVIIPDIDVVEYLEDSERGDKGFGSSGR